MRRPRLQFLAIALLALTACSPKPVKAAGGDGELVLELGTGHRSLAASLRSLGVTLLPPKTLDQAPVEELPAEPAPAPGASPGTNPDANSGTQPSPGVQPAPTQPPVDDASYFEVVLQPKQTLIDLAKKHLGSGAKFTEILKANGWTEADARRLKAGRKIKIPKQAESKAPAPKPAAPKPAAKKPQ